MNKTELLNKAARDGEERVFLARVLDRLEQAELHNTPSHTGFMTEGERAGVETLLHLYGASRYRFSGGYDSAERTICIFFPDWMEEDDGEDEEMLAHIRCSLPRNASVTHRDILGSVMGIGITREKVGDIIVEENNASIIVVRECTQIVLSQLLQVGRYPASCSLLPLSDISVKPAEVKQIRDTVATLRLDAVAASGFSIGRNRASELISSGRLHLNHRECLKPDKQVVQGDVLTCRGLGKCTVKEILGESRKGRIMILLERYI